MDINQVLNSFSDELSLKLQISKLTKSNKLYERIIVSPNRRYQISLTAYCRQIFQTEVGQYVNANGANLLNGSKGPFKPRQKPANFDNNIFVQRQHVYLYGTRPRKVHRQCQNRREL